MTISLPAKGAMSRVGVSESHAIADAAARQSRAETKYAKTDRVTRDRDKAERRAFQHENQRSDRLPVLRTLGELKRAFRDAAQAEMPLALHGPGVEPDSALGSRRWSSGFRVYITGDGWSRDRVTGELRYPLRASISEMAQDPSSNIQRTGAALLYLLLLDGEFDHVRAWRALLGATFSKVEAADSGFLHGTADPITEEALRRWWKAYVKLVDADRPRRTIPEGVGLMGSLPHCEHATPNCPHGRSP